MTSPTNRYPLATNKGDDIPLDVIRPVSVVKKTFLSASATAAIVLPTTAQVLIILATADLLIKFSSGGTAAAALVDGTITADVMFVPANTLYTVSPPIGKNQISLIGDSANGTAVIQILETWAALTTASQTVRA